MFVNTETIVIVAARTSFFEMDDKNGISRQPAKNESCRSLRGSINRPVYKGLNTVRFFSSRVYIKYKAMLIRKFLRKECGDDGTVRYGNFCAKLHAVW